MIDKEQKLLEALSLILYEEDNTDLADLLKITDVDTFSKIIDLFDGRTITFPTKEEFRESLNTALYFYYKEVKGLKSYDALKKLHILDDDKFSSISIGMKIHHLKRKIQDSIVDKLEEIDNG